VAILLLSAHEVDTDAARIFVEYGEMVVHVAELVTGALLPSAGGKRLHRMHVALHPGRFVEAVNRLFVDVIARQPAEVEPVADFVFHAAPIGLVAAVPERRRDVTGLDADGVADRLVLGDATDGFDNGRMIPPAQARNDRQILRLRLGTGIEDAADARRVDRDRFFYKRVLALFHGVS